MRLIDKFLRLESASGFLLIVGLTLAIFAENTPLKPYYDMLLSTPVELQFGALHLAKPLLLWVNEALMAIFFFLVGLELKREILIGELSSSSKIALPISAAIIGIVMPGLIYTAINYADPVAMKGWAIPTATDIAFALGIISLLGDRVPAALKLLLLAVAIIDDIGAIVIIAFFYSGAISPSMFLVIGVALFILLALNKNNIPTATPYIMIGIILWVAILKSGVHATLAGILLAMFIPLKSSDNEESGEEIEDREKSLLIRLEHDLHPTVAYVILPVFAFANAGISFTGLKLSNFLAPVPLGIALGLVVGKQIGIFGSVWLAVKMRLAQLPEGINWLQVYGLSILCGIGFTMSLFISSLAFEQDGMVNVVNYRLGIIIGSLFSAVLGYIVLRYASEKK